MLTCTSRIPPSITMRRKVAAQLERPAYATASPSSNGHFVHNSAEQGGALALALDEALIENSSFSQNLARNEGGAIATWRGDIDINNSTFHSNVAKTAGAVFVDGGIVTLTHLTMLNNAATGGTAAGLRKFKGKVYLRNSIIAGSVGASECFGRLSQNAGNLIEDESCNPEYGGDPKLDYVDGLSPHFVPRDDSPAISAAYRQFCPDRDQIGRARPQGTGCDIGAIESTSAGARGAGPLAGVCTLADRILAANTNQAVGNCPAGSNHDIITITEDITLRVTLPPITGTITIDGGGHTISGGKMSRIFVVSGGNLTAEQPDADGWLQRRRRRRDSRTSWRLADGEPFGFPRQPRRPGRRRH